MAHFVENSAQAFGRARPWTDHTHCIGCGTCVLTKKSQSLVEFSKFDKTYPTRKSGKRNVRFNLVAANMCLGHACLGSRF
jgi:Fe-S-cluster-containing dehydrogenase component